MPRSRVTARRWDRTPPASELWRQKQIEYTWTHTLAGRYVEFWTLTQRAPDYCFERFPSVDRKLRSDLLNAYLKLDAYPDARAGAHANLKAQGERTAILTNGSPAMVNSAVEAAGLKPVLDVVLSIDAVRLFKTHPDLRAGNQRVRLPAGRRGVRVVEPLGRHRRDRLRLPHRLDQPRQGAGRISRLPAGSDGLQPERLLSAKR